MKVATTRKELDGWFIENHEVIDEHSTQPPFEQWPHDVDGEDEVIIINRHDFTMNTKLFKFCESEHPEISLGGKPFLTSRQYHVNVVN